MSTIPTAMPSTMARPGIAERPRRTARRLEKAIPRTRLYPVWTAETRSSTFANAWCFNYVWELPGKNLQGLWVQFWVDGHTTASGRFRPERTGSRTIRCHAPWFLIQRLATGLNVCSTIRSQPIAPTRVATTTWTTEKMIDRTRACYFASTRRNGREGWGGVSGAYVPIFNCPAWGALVILAVTPSLGPPLVCRYDPGEGLQVHRKG